MSDSILCPTHYVIAFNHITIKKSGWITCGSTVAGEGCRYQYRERKQLRYNLIVWKKLWKREKNYEVKKEFARIKKKQKNIVRMIKKFIMKKIHKKKEKKYKKMKNSKRWKESMNEEILS